MAKTSARVSWTDKKDVLWYLSFPNQKPGTRCYWCRLRHDKLLHRNSYRVWNLSPMAGIVAGASVWTSSWRTVERSPRKCRMVPQTTLCNKIYQIDIFIQEEADLQLARLVWSYWDPEKTGAKLTSGSVVGWHENPLKSGPVLVREDRAVVCLLCYTSCWLTGKKKWFSVDSLTPLHFVLR